MIVTQDHGNHRSLCANLAAANCFTKDHIVDPDNMKLIEAADYFYIGVSWLNIYIDSENLAETLRDAFLHRI